MYVHTDNWYGCFPTCSPIHVSIHLCMSTVTQQQGVTPPQAYLNHLIVNRESDMICDEGLWIPWIRYCPQHSRTDSFNHLSQCSWQRRFGVYFRLECSNGFTRSIIGVRPLLGDAPNTGSPLGALHSFDHRFPFLLSSMQAFGSPWLRISHKATSIFECCYLNHMVASKVTRSFSLVL